MGRRFVLSLVLLLCAEAMLAQVATTSSTSTSTINTSLPVAYVYVSSSHYIHAYKAWANGTYTSITGSPFPFAGIRKMSVTKNFLFGADGVNLVTYSIHSNGSISKRAPSNQESTSRADVLKSVNWEPRSISVRQRCITSRVPMDSTRTRISRSTFSQTDLCSSSEAQAVP